MNFSCYCDTSILASLYFNDKHSDQVIEWSETAELPIPLTNLGELELTGAIEQRLFRKEISAREAMLCQHQIQEDIISGFYRRCLHQEENYIKALQLVRQHTAIIGCHALDVLHIASALLLEANTFLTYDHRQKLLAHVVGFKTIDF